MMSAFYRFQCSNPTCLNKISDKSHQWCQKMGIKDYCFDHIPTETRIEIAQKRYGKTEYKTT